MANYRILSLDGGGAWSLIQVRALAAIYGEDAKGHDVLGKFDLVAANSGGSLVAAGLATNLPLKEILAYFMDEKKRRSIFVKLKTRGVLHFLFGIGPRYRTAAKIEGLRGVLGQTGDILLSRLPAEIPSPKPTHFLLVGFDYDRERAMYFRSNLDSRASSGARDTVRLAEAVHASTNAPINYFDEPALVAEILENGQPKPPRRFWDGAITGLNNPVMAAVVEALANGEPPANIQVLSIGTGNSFLPMAAAGDPAEHPKMLQPQSKQSVLKDVIKISRSVLADPPDAATFIAHVILGQSLPDHGEEVPCFGNGTVVRMNPLIQPVWHEDDGIWRWPMVTGGLDFPALVDMDMDAVEQKEVDLINRFCTAWLKDQVYNQPLRVKTKRLKCSIGHRWFSGALARWNAMTA